MTLKYDFLDIANQAKPIAVSSLSKLEALYPELDALVLTSKDAFMSEYVPLENNPRFGASGFTGSLGDCIYWTESFRKKHSELKPISLFVDGRYHLQADQEVSPDRVQVVKIDVEANIEKTLQKKLTEYPGVKLGIDFERTSIAALERFKNEIESVRGSITAIEGESVLKTLDLKGWKVDRPIFSLSEKHTGRTVKEILRALTLDMHQHRLSPNSGTLHMTCATDDAAFLTNTRGFHLPHTASFLAFTFLIENEFILFLPACSQDAQIQLDHEQWGEFKLTVIRNQPAELKKALEQYQVDQVFYLAATMNGLLPSLISDIFPQAKIHSNFDWIRRTRVQKTEAERNSIRTSFVRSSQAISKALRFGKTESQKRNVSELELAHFLKNEYAREGAVSLSFKTISGAGPNSAIVHYSEASSEQFFKSGMMALLDSGAYYEEGFCTDCTRGFFVGGGSSSVKPAAWQKEIYTACLKSAIQVFLKPVDAKLSGKEIDALVRAQVKNAGYDYAHGTGHGIGIHVHEEGIRFSTLSQYDQTPYACVSVEPGIYLKDHGGVRVENVVFLIPEGKTHYRYENLVWVGYDWDLIDVEKLSEDEKTYLANYELECQKRGTQLTHCPLLQE